MTWITTIDKLKGYGFSEKAVKKLTEGLGKPSGYSGPIFLKGILNFNSIEDAIWALRCFEGEEKRYFFFLWS